MVGQSLNQMEKILKKLEDRANNRVQPTASATEQDLGPAMVHLQQLFTVDNRKALWSASTAAGTYDEMIALRDLTVSFLKAGRETLNKASPELLNLLGRENYCPDGEEDCEKTKMSFFHAVKKETSKDYARRLAYFVAICFTLVDTDGLADQCGLKIKPAVKTAIETMRAKFDEDKTKVENLRDFLLTMASQEYLPTESYNFDLFCSCAIGMLFDKDCGKYTSKESANKSLSAFKYSIRMAFLFKLAQSTSHADTKIVEKIRFKKHGNKYTFKQLTILQAGVNALPRKLKPAAMVLDMESERISYNGIPCSFDLLNDVLFDQMESAEDELLDLLMGFSPEDEPESSDVYIHFIPDYAFGKETASRYGDDSIFRHVMSDPELLKMFFKVRACGYSTFGSKFLKTRQATKPVAKEATKYLKKCRALEKHLVVIMHILLGCGSRATDYNKLTFMNGEVESEERHISIYNDDYLHCAMPNNKLTELRGKSQAYSNLLPRSIVDKLLVTYWKYVRPFAAMLMEFRAPPNREKSAIKIDRWRRYCFINPDPKWVRQAVFEAFDGNDKGRTFQWLRHSAAFLLDMFVKCEVPSAERPVFKLFGHSETTHRSYAVEKLAGFSSEDCTNVTDIRVMLEIYWDKLSSDERKENPVDCIEYSDEDESSYADSDADISECSEDSSDKDSSDTTEDLSDSSRETAPDQEVIFEATQEDTPPEQSSEMSMDTNVHEEVDNSSGADLTQSRDIEQAFVRASEDEEDSESQLTTTGTNNLVFRAVSKLGISSFKSKAQEELVHKVLLGDSSVLGVLPTGGGKSLAIFASLHFNERKLTVAVFPLVAVLNDVKGRLDELVCKGLLHNSKYRLWGKTKDTSICELVNCGTRLVLVSAEEAQDTRFHTFLRQGKEAVASVIFDEAPVFTSSAFRKNLRAIPVMLRSITAAKFVLLSATVPIDAEKKLLEDFGTPNAASIRMCTTNWNLNHIVKRISGESISYKLIASYLKNPQDCAVVFVKSIAECKLLAERLQSMAPFTAAVTCYHSRLTNEERHSAHQSWLSGSKRIIVATTGFAFGVDSAICNLVIHVDGAFNLETYCQGAGRAGRNGQKAQSIILLSGRTHHCDDKRLDHFLNNQRECRRVILGSILDPSSMATKRVCGGCDYCTRRGFAAEQLDPRTGLDVAVRNAVGSPCQERQEASKRLAQTRKLAKTVQKCLNSHVNRSTKHCFICTVVENKKVAHKFNQCPYFKNKCFRCGAAHKRSKCKIEKCWANTCTSNAVCVTCCTPCVSMVANFHHGESTVGARCMYRDTVVPACLALWRKKTSKVLELIHEKEKEESVILLDDINYTRWLSQVNDGISNATWLIATVLSTRKSDTDSGAFANRR